MPRLVVLETPYKGLGTLVEGDIEKNIEYAKKCMRDSFMRGEYPFASHLLYTQKGILDDDIPEERTLGIEAGLSWVKNAEATIVYTDLGISNGMKHGIERAEKDGRLVEYRQLAI